jgi:hypothetical protein
MRRKDDPLSIAAPVLRAYEDSAFAKSSAAHGATVKDDESRRNAYTSVHITLGLDLIIDHPGKGYCAERAHFKATRSPH